MSDTGKYTLWTCPREAWNPLLDEIMQEVGKKEIERIAKEAVQEAANE